MESEPNTSRSSETLLALDFGTPDMSRKSSVTSPIPVRTAVSSAPSWKAVGSPATSSGPLDGLPSENPNFGLFKKPSTANIGSYIGSELDGGVPVSSLLDSNSESAGGSWGGPGISWNNQSIWSEQNVDRTSPSKPSVYGAENYSGMLPIPGGPIPHYRQQRSFSIAYGQQGVDFLDDLDEKERHRQTLEALGEELTDEEYENIFKLRFRSKSSFGTYHFPPSQNSVMDAISAPPGFENERGSNASPHLHALWGQQSIGNDLISANRRRSIANPVSFGNMWDKNVGVDPASTGISAYAKALNAERLERSNQHRRYSLAPSPSFAEMHFSDPAHETQTNHRANLESDYNMSGRRHSVAVPGLPYPDNQQTDAALSETLGSIDINDPTCIGSTGNSHKQTEEYAEKDIHQRSYSNLGKGVPLNTLPSQGPLYIVKFKAGRTDVFYTAEGSGLTCRKGDLVIVEADRGKDLGKIINDSVTPKQLELLQQSQARENALSDSRPNSKEIQPKLIYHLAQPSEIALLAAKNQDEAKAMLVCQTKVRQKKLPMEVMDAEYQWDRRKLTFYFVAQRRIDFRELVRDLFKIYKTRIWMCAVNTSPITALLSAVDSPLKNNQSSTDINKE